MSDEPDHFRWSASVTYRTDAGPTEIEYHFEELHELHDLIERGPDWNTLVQIFVVLNPFRVLHPDDTIEKAIDR